MTPEEKAVYEHLVLAYNSFIALPQSHPDDKFDFGDGIRQLQNLMLSRVGARTVGWAYTEGGMRIEYNESAAE
jgi:hypothetical protein